MQTKVRRMSAPENTPDSTDIDTEIAEALSAFAPVGHAAVSGDT